MQICFLQKLPGGNNMFDFGITDRNIKNFLADGIVQRAGDLILQQGGKQRKRRIRTVRQKNPYKLFR